jgi:VWFA-related protein
MKLQKKTFKWVGLVAIPTVLATAIVAGQGQSQQPGQSQGPAVFRTASNYVTTDVIARDKDGKFVPNLRAEEFKVFEDGIQQKLTRFVSSIGGRSFTEIASPTESTTRRSEGLILPPTRPKMDASGRIFIIFIDDLHLQVGDTPRVKAALADIRDKLIHDNDLVGFVSTGPSSIEINPAYDFGHKRFNEAIGKVMGAGMSINDIIEQAKYEAKTGPVGLQHNAHNAFKTAYGMMQQLVQIPDRRKSFIYVSSGYTFDPFRDARYARIQMEYQNAADTPTETVNDVGLDINRPIGGPYDVDTPLADQYYMQKTEFLESELIGELAQITREARRSNIVFYTLDPRGLTAGMSIEVRGVNKYEDWRDYVMTQTNSLKVLGEETGGFCICQTNDYTKGLQRIDAETSDYYIVGYVSSNPDPFKVQRTIKIEVTRPGVDQLIYRNSYTIPKTKKPAAERAATTPPRP